MARKTSLPRDIQCTARVTSPVPMSTLRRWTREAAELLRLPVGDISVTIIGPTESKALNGRYRQKDYPTNVLTFPAQKGSGECGDILLCASIIRTEAKALQQTPSQYTKFLLQHGCIHLLGLDHQTDAEAKRWQRYEQRLV